MLISKNKKDENKNKMKKGPFKLRKVNSPMKCWKNYKQVCYKKKGGRTVPNCVPKKK